MRARCRHLHLAQHLDRAQARIILQEMLRRAAGDRRLVQEVHTLEVRPLHSYTSADGFAFQYVDIHRLLRSLQE